MTNEFGYLTTLQQSISYEANCLLTAVSCTKIDEGWRVMLKVRDRQNRPMVSFTVAPTLEGCFHLIEAALHTTGAHLKWKEDKWPKS